MPGLTADMRAGEADILAQEVDEQGARLDEALHLLAIDHQGNGELLDFGHGSAWPRIGRRALFEKRRL